MNAPDNHPSWLGLGLGLGYGAPSQLSNVNRSDISMRSFDYVTYRPRPLLRSSPPHKSWLTQKKCAVSSKTC